MNRNCDKVRLIQFFAKLKFAFSRKLPTVSRSHSKIFCIRLLDRHMTNDFSHFKHQGIIR